MSGDVRPWYRRPWKVVGLVFVGLIGVGILALGAAIVRDIILIKSGKLDPSQTSDQQLLKASVSTRFANTTVTAQDLARLIPPTPVPTLGSPKATLKIVEFVDYGCPYCKQTAPNIHAFMATHATDTELVIRDFPIVELHPEAEVGAIAADCVFRIAPEKYWGYYDRLFTSQPNPPPTDLGPYEADLQLFAQQAGVDMAKYTACVEQQLPLASIKQSEADGSAAGVQGTPTFFFNGVKIEGALDEPTLEVIANEARRRIQ